jgi:hypothetical protein
MKQLNSIFVQRWSKFYFKKRKNIFTFFLWMFSTRKTFDHNVYINFALLGYGASDFEECNFFRLLFKLSLRFFNFFCRPLHKKWKTDVCVYGREGDCHIFNRSVLVTRLDNNQLNIPPFASLPNINDDPLPHAIVRDEAFGLRKYLLKPQACKGLKGIRGVFSYWLTRARRFV